MDLSRLKWPVIIVVVGGLSWLMTAGGNAWLENRLLSYEPGESAELDKANEQALSNLAGWYIRTFRHEKGIEILEETGERYPNGKNYYHNLYRRSRAHEVLGDASADRTVQENQYGSALEILSFLINNNVHQLDERVPETSLLQHRYDAIAETSGIGEVGGYAKGM